jgi:hypothetical protein
MAIEDRGSAADPRAAAAAATAAGTLSAGIVQLEQQALFGLGSAGEWLG